LVALTAIAFFTLVAVLKNVPASQAAFALLALEAVLTIKFKGRKLDEREKEIAEKAMMASFGALWVVFIGLVMTLGFVKGWDATLSLRVWMLSSTIWWAVALVLAVEAVTTLVLYRRG
jgi:polyferredoxin